MTTPAINGQRFPSIFPLEQFSSLGSSLHDLVRDRNSDLADRSIANLSAFNQSFFLKRLKMRDETFENKPSIACSSNTPSLTKKTMELTDATLESTELSLLWSANDGRIGHQRGEVYQTNLWIDRTRTNDLWTCYGPYENLPPGRYRATWGISFRVSCPPLVTASDYWVLEMDVVANVATRTLWGPKGVTWAHACEGDGNVAAEFDVPDGATQIEVRLRKRKWADELIARFLLIERI
jgi:hypothetical protein